MNETSYKSSKGLAIKYMFRSGKYDANTLVVIFSGFGAKSLFTYDFAGGSLANCKSHILWIKDEVKDLPSFYLDIPQINFESGVRELILFFQNKYGIDNDRVLVVGASKGGFAALYYALTANIKNVIVSAPIIELGSFLLTTQTKRKILEHITGSNKIDQEVIERLNHKIYDLVQKSSHSHNLYIFNSPCDEHENGDKLFSILHTKDNICCNRVVSESKLTYQHNVITRYFSNFISGLCNIFAYTSCLPSLGGGNFTLSDKSSPKVQVEQKAVAEIKNFNISGNNISLSGYAFVKGLPSPGYGLYSKSIIFKSKVDEILFAVGSVKNPDLSTVFFENNYIDYLTGGIETFAASPINLMNIPTGDFKIEALIQDNKSKKKYKCPVKYKGAQIVFNVESGFVILFSLNGCAAIRKLGYTSNCEPTYFSIDKCAIESANKLFISGKFIIRSLVCDSWGALKPFLILRSTGPVIQTYCFELGQKTDLANEFITGEIGPYSKSSFANRSQTPINLNCLPNGEYDLAISCIAGSFLYTKKFGVLSIKEHEANVLLMSSSNS